MSASLREICGMALVVIGLIAMPLPVIPGLPILAAGAALLGADHRWVRKARTWLRLGDKQ
ncbi:MAG: hypothetical protein JSU00_12175 [Acidobacteria bacterium]|nr:hypothetical protein [Acidobacteriota bacterium]